MALDDTSRTSLGDYLKALPQYLYPHHLFSRLMHRLTRCRCRWFVAPFTRWFVAHFRVALEEAREPDLSRYDHFNAFFTRELKPGVRPLEGDEATVVSPVDGCVSQAGPIREGRIVQAKGRDYSVAELLGGDPELAALFDGGSFSTIYLSPRDYHRIHMPAAGELRRMVHVPGRLFSVNPATARVVPRLFARNERVVALFETSRGPMAMIAVGAIFVGSVETVWAGEVTPPHRAQVTEWRYPEGEMRFARGAEMGRFNMGSTVILLFARDRVEWSPQMAPGAVLRMGQRIA